MDVDQRGEDWGFINIGSDWELKWWMNNTMVSEHPIGHHIETDGGNFDCDPKTGAFYLTWTDEDDKFKSIFFFSHQTLTNWLELPGW